MISNGMKMLMVVETWPESWQNW